MYNLGVGKCIRTSLLLAMLLGLSWPCAAQAAEQLRELPGTVFHCELHPWLEGRTLGADSQAGYATAEELGMQVLNISGFMVNWPKSARSCRIFSGQYGDMLGSGGQPLETSICVGLSDNDMQIVDFGSSRTPGFLSKVAVWPDQRDADARLVVLASFSNGFEESAVRGFSVSPDGSVSMLEMSNASTQWGEFQVSDLDDNGSYELLCYRNLDGMLGGLSYRSVRGYDQASGGYLPAAQQHRRFFELERDWLDWVIDTRSLIIANPLSYFNEEGSGAYYQAEYKGMSYGFDTVIFIDNAGYDRNVARDADFQAREAFRRVRNYRDELNEWLAGGETPATWGIQ